MPSFLSSILSRFKGQERKPACVDVVKSAPAEKKTLFMKIVADIDNLITAGELPGVCKKEDNYLVSYYLGDRRICNVNKLTDPPRTCFYYSGANLKARELNRPGLKAISRNEARQKGYGHAKAIYSGRDTEIILSMVKSALT
ncbi:hypothetical protein [Desulfotomaculum copahuensis]|uniref:YdhG-like domain-containing protein n=1 Tax=Desulfotomaculum copahuensis TaxID=1838280 RepID=A0A1B7LHM6_9FIRM|nr:hypothetical protein [Desulfotomaculum copahuensis]OAT85608.1 hypothetical protein A6M21_05705 [Desulfotomaculum copahuensis]